MTVRSQHKILYITKFLPLLPKKYYLVPGQKVPRPGSPIFCVCDGPKYLYKFMTLPLKDYYLIPNNNALKLVCVFLSLCID